MRSAQSAWPRPILRSAECDRASKRARPLARGAAVIAALDDPFAVRVAAREQTDLMRQHHHHADAGRGRTSPTGPVAGEIEGRTGILADQAARVPAAPGARTPTADARGREDAVLTQADTSLAVP